MFQALGWISRIQRRKLSLEPILIWETRQIMCNPFQRNQRYFWRHIIYICKVVIRVWEIVYNNRVNLQMHNMGVRVKRFRFFFFFSDKLLSNIHYNYLSSLGLFLSDHFRVSACHVIGFQQKCVEWIIEWLVFSWKLWSSWSLSQNTMRVLSRIWLLSFHRLLKMIGFNKCLLSSFCNSFLLLFFQYWKAQETSCLRDLRKSSFKYVLVLERVNLSISSLPN